MLRQRAQDTEFNATVSAVRAPVNLLLVAWALQVGVECLESIKRAVTEETLVCIAIPRAFSGPGLSDGGGRISIWSADEACWIRDEIITIPAYDHAIQLCPSHSGGTRPRLKMQYERGPRNERLPATGARAVYVLRLVYRRVEVCVEVILVLEDATAGNAIPVLLTVVFVKSGICSKYCIA